MDHLEAILPIARSDKYDLIVIVIDGVVSHAALLLGATTNARSGTRQLTNLKVMSSEGVEVEGGAVEEVGVGLEHPLFGGRIDPVDLNFHAADGVCVDYQVNIFVAVGRDAIGTLGTR